MTHLWQVLHGNGKMSNRESDMETKDDTLDLNLSSSKAKKISPTNDDYSNFKTKINDFIEDTNYAAAKLLTTQEKISKLENLSKQAEKLVYLHYNYVRILHDVYGNLLAAASEWNEKFEDSIVSEDRLTNFTSFLHKNEQTEALDDCKKTKKDKLSLIYHGSQYTDKESFSEDTEIVNAEPYDLNVKESEVPVKLEVELKCDDKVKDSEDNHFLCEKTGNFKQFSSDRSVIVDGFISQASSSESSLIFDINENQSCDEASTIILERDDEDTFNAEREDGTAMEISLDNKCRIEDPHVNKTKEEALKFLYENEVSYSSSTSSSSLSSSDIEGLKEYSLRQKERKKHRKKCKTKKTKKNNLTDSSSSDLNLSSDSDSDRSSSMSSSQNNEMENFKYVSKSDIVENVLDDVQPLTSSDNSDVESDIDKKCSKKKRKIDSQNEQVAESVNKKICSRETELSNEKGAETSWRNDPLLRGNLSPHRKTNTENTHESEDKSVSHVKRQTERAKKDKETIILPESLEEEFSLLTSSESDSDLEFVNETKKESVTIDSENEKEKLDSPKKSGRRNIRGIMSHSELEEASQRATIAEVERIKRVSDNNRSINSFLSNASCLEKFVLDLDLENDVKIFINDNLANRLKNHQKDGVRFMWDNCYESITRCKTSPGNGCILAHTMGLGKTFQVITLIHTLFKHKETDTKHVLIVCPLSTVYNWIEECKIAINLAKTDSFNIFSISGQMKTEKHIIIRKWYEDSRSILILGYESFERLSKVQEVKDALVDPGPDLVVCDEAHLLKNEKTLRAASLNKIKTRRRIMLTGTPLQNHLREYYYMVQFVKPNLLGSYKEYLNRFVNPIMNGQYHDSTQQDINAMKKRSHVLHKILKNTVQRYEVSELYRYLPSKLDYVLFIRLHPLQIQLYKHYVETLCKKEIHMSALFTHHHILQLLLTHPHLLQMKADELKKNNTLKKKEIDVINLDPKIQEKPTLLPENWWKNIFSPNMSENIDYGPKLKVMLSIIEDCEKKHDKLLIFSTSILELDIVEQFLKTHGTSTCKPWRKNVDYYRMDGLVPPKRRNELCILFNRADNQLARVFLVSHKVGGLGLNLFAANRVILMDVHWNPAYDNQSIFRVYRFGQSKQCYVYRFVTLGTIEEVIYERSVTKSAIACRVIDKRQITRHYKSHELQEMFRFKVYTDVERPPLKVPEDDLLANLLQKHNTEIFRYHEHQALLENRPDEELNADEMRSAWEEFNKEKLIRENTAAPILIPVTSAPSQTVEFTIVNTQENTNITNGNIPSTSNGTNVFQQPRLVMTLRRKSIGQVSNNTNVISPLSTATGIQQSSETVTVASTNAIIDSNLHSANPEKLLLVNTTQVPSKEIIGGNSNNSLKAPGHPQTYQRFTLPCFKPIIIENTATVHFSELNNNKYLPQNVSASNNIETSLQNQGTNCVAANNIETPDAHIVDKNSYNQKDVIMCNTDEPQQSKNKVNGESLLVATKWVPYKEDGSVPCKDRETITIDDDSQEQVIDLEKMDLSR